MQTLVIPVLYPNCLPPSKYRDHGVNVSIFHIWYGNILSLVACNIIIVISHDEICITPGARLARLERHLEIRRHSNPPTAMVLSPPFFFRQARRVAPQRRGRIEGGVRPATIMRVRMMRTIITLYNMHK